MSTDMTDDEIALGMVRAMRAICHRVKTRDQARKAVAENFTGLDLSGPLAILPEYLRLPE